MKWSTTYTRLQQGFIALVQVFAVSSLGEWIQYNHCTEIQPQCCTFEEWWVCGGHDEWLNAIQLQFMFHVDDCVRVSGMLWVSGLLALNFNNKKRYSLCPCRHLA